MSLSCDFQAILEAPAGLAKGSSQTRSLRLLREGSLASQMPSYCNAANCFVRAESRG
jgi:hypothetical protein